MGFTVIHQGELPVDHDANWHSLHMKCCWNCGNGDVHLSELKQLDETCPNCDYLPCRKFGEMVRWDWYCDNYKDIEKIDNIIYKVKYIEED